MPSYPRHAVTLTFPEGTGSLLTQGVSGAPADFYARWRCERHDATYSAGVAAYQSGPVPRPRFPFDPNIADAMLDPTSLKTLFVGRRCSFRRPQLFRSERALVLRSKPQLSYSPQLNDGPLHHAVLPNLSGWLGISRPPSFPPPLGRTRQSRPRKLSPGVYDYVPPTIQRPQSYP